MPVGEQNFLQTASNTSSGQRHLRVASLLCVCVCVLFFLLCIVSLLLLQKFLPGTPYFQHCRGDLWSREVPPHSLRASVADKWPLWPARLEQPFAAKCSDGAPTLLVRPTANLNPPHTRRRTRRPLTHHQRRIQPHTYVCVNLYSVEPSGEACFMVSSLAACRIV